MKKFSCHQSLKMIALIFTAIILIGMIWKYPVILFVMVIAPVIAYFIQTKRSTSP